MTERKFKQKAYIVKIGVAAVNYTDKDVSKAIEDALEDLETPDILFTMLEIKEIPYTRYTKMMRLEK